MCLQLLSQTSLFSLYMLLLYSIFDLRTLIQNPLMSFLFVLPYRAVQQPRVPHEALTNLGIIKFVLEDLPTLNDYLR